MHVVGSGPSGAHLGLLVEVRSQLDQPGGLHRRHVTHVVLCRLHHFVEDDPVQRFGVFLMRFSFHT